MFPAIDRLRTLRVRDLMSKGVVEISAHLTMDEAADQFLSQGISSAPVIDEQGRCVGMLSAADYLKRDRPHRGAGSSDDHSLVGGRADDAWEIMDAPDTVNRYMAQSVQSIAASSPLMEAARVMCGAHVHRLPVVEDDRVVGIVSSMDIVAALLNVIDELKVNQLDL